MDNNCKPSKRGLRMAMGGAFTQDTSPSALEQRLNARLAAGTLTVRGAGMLSDIENQRRNDATQRLGIGTQADTSRYGIDAQSATARMNDATQRYGVDTNAVTSRYGIDTQAGTARMNDATQRHGIGTQADTARYGFDTSAATARMNDATQRYGISTQADTARMNDATNRFGMNLNANTQRYGYDSGRASSMYGADSNLLSNMWRMKEGGEIQPTRLGMRNGGEIHAANGFMPGGYAERGGSIKWLSPYDGIKAQASLADMDLKQDALRAQTEALRAQTERADRGPTQDQVNATRLADDQARQRFAWEREDRGLRNKIAHTMFDTKLRNDTQDRAFSAQQYQDSRLDAQNARAAEMSQYGMAQDAAGRAAIAENNRRQDAIAAAHTNVGVGGNDPYEAQDRARLNERRNMYDKALRGHFNAGGFGAMRSGLASAAPLNSAVPRFGLRNGGQLRADAALQDGSTYVDAFGGVVPGKGKGDKFRAKYERGEFVVSNDMLDAEPELGDHLRGLRAKVLAAKGMTPEEADAKAIHMDSEGPGDERGAKDERESKAVKRGFGLRAQSGGDLFGPDFFGTDEENARLIAAAKAEKAAKDAESNQVRVDEYGNPVVGLEKWLGRTSGTRVVAPASDSAPPDAQDLGARDRQRIAQHKAASQSPSNAATQEEMRTAFDSRETPTKPASKDAPAVLQGATGKDVGFGITRFNVPGQSPLFTNMTDEAGMRSNEALISRKPQSDTDRIAGDNLANRFAQRQGAEDRMAQRQAELQAEYQQGQVDNRAIASSERQREFLNEQRNLERNIPNKEEAPGVNARIAALKAARLGEGANFGARENALALDQARSAATIGVHAGDNASRERIADKELAAKAPGYALDRELTQEKISHERELNAAQKGYAGAIAAGNKNAADMYREQIVALSNKLSDSKFSAIPGRVVPDPMGGEPHVIPPTIWDSHSGQIVQQKGGANQVARSISPGEVVNGFRFKGGNTKDRNNWEKV